jgi:hypothetical protein
MQMWSIGYRPFLVVQSVIVAGLLVASFIVYLCYALLPDRVPDLFLQKFDVAQEASLPTWFSSFNLLLSSVIALLIAQARAHTPILKRYWLVLSLIMLCLSLDEIVMIHEAGGALAARLDLDAAILRGRSWVIWGAAFVVVVAVAFVPFLMWIPKRTTVLIILAGGIFVTGALGFEVLGAVMLNMNIREGFAHDFRRLIEEGLEMYGIVVLNVALLREYGSDGSPSVIIIIGTD